MQRGGKSRPHSSSILSIFGAFHSRSALLRLRPDGPAALFSVEPPLGDPGADVVPDGVDGETDVDHRADTDHDDVEGFGDGRCGRLTPFVLRFLDSGWTAPSVREPSCSHVRPATVAFSSRASATCARPKDSSVSLVGLPVAVSHPSSS